MKLSNLLTAAGTSLIFIFVFTPAQATSTNVVLDLEGNPTCSSLGPNTQILEFRDSNPDSSPGIPKQVTLNFEGGTQLLEYTVFNTTPPTMDWAIKEVNGNPVDGTEEQQALFNQSVRTINYTILKAQGGNNGARVFHFGAAANFDGAIADENEEAPGSNLAAATFCYGLTTGFIPQQPPIEFADIPACEELTNSELFTTGIICPTTGPGGVGDPEEQLIINMSLNDPRFGFDVNTDTIRACTCNSELKACNPALPAQRVDSNGNYINELGQFVDQNGMVITDPITADDLSRQDRTCLEFGVRSDGELTGVNERVPWRVEGVENPDSYICYTIDGVRTCYGHF